MAGLREFVVQFGTEQQCIEHLAGLRWPGGFACAGCGGRQAWRLKARPRVYECATCHRQESATAGTVFHRTRTDLTKWFFAAYLMGRDKRGVSARHSQGVSDRTADAIMLDEVERIVDQTPRQWQQRTGERAELR